MKKNWPLFIRKKIMEGLNFMLCVVDAFASRAHKLLPQAGDIIAVVFIMHLERFITRAWTNCQISDCSNY